MKNDIKKASIKFLGRSVIFSAFYADFCLCQNSVIITTLNWAVFHTHFLFLFLNEDISLPIFQISGKTEQSNNDLGSVSGIVSFHSIKKNRK